MHDEMLNALPEKVVEIIRSNVTIEFATVSAAGVPIDTPLLYFPSEGLKTIDVATGVGYPAKAERARRNPKTGLLIEGGPGEPVVSIAGMSAVQDRDLQANVERYLSETAWSIPLDPPWSHARKAVWYWSRIIVSVTPSRIRWWDSAETMDEPPHCWDAPEETRFPESDPAPPGRLSSAPQWPQVDWRAMVEGFLAGGVGGHLTLCDTDGFPLPIRARGVELTRDGIRLDMPAGVPWSRRGKATLTFLGAATLVGEVSADGRSTLLAVERALPILPIVSDPTELWDPSPSTRAELMRRLEHETARRGQPIPTLPETLPAFTQGAHHRMANVGQFAKSLEPLMPSAE
jgi:hypothetical protein